MGVGVAPKIDKAAPAKGFRGSSLPCFPIKMGAILAVKSIVAVLGIALASTAAASAQTQAPLAGTYDVSDEGLVKSLPGFISSFATVNGIRLHYVAGGKGSPMLLLPGWPETWWAFHKIMPDLAKKGRPDARSV